MKSSGSNATLGPSVTHPVGGVPEDTKLGHGQLGQGQALAVVHGDTTVSGSESRLKWVRLISSPESSSRSTQSTIMRRHPGRRGGRGSGARRPGGHAPAGGRRFRRGPSSPSGRSSDGARRGCTTPWVAPSPSHRFRHQGPFDCRRHHHTPDRSIRKTENSEGQGLGVFLHQHHARSEAVGTRSDVNRLGR